MIPTTIRTVAPWHVRLVRSVAETLNSLREEWLGWVAVILLAFAFLDLVLAALHHFWPLHLIATEIAPWAKIADKTLGATFIGTLWVLTGTVWSILGVFIPASQVTKLRTWEDQRIVPTREILRALRVASNFGKSGAIFILFGSIILLEDILASASK